MSQPKWKCVGQLGDASPTEYGGAWVFVDETGVYPPEVEILECPDSDDSKEPYTVYRVVLGPHTYIKGILSANRFHPDHQVWYANELNQICLCVDWKVKEIIECFCSDDALKRYEAYRAVAAYYGWREFDHYPLTLTKREVSARYRRKVYRVVK